MLIIAPSAKSTTYVLGESAVTVKRLIERVEWVGRQVIQYLTL